MNEVSLKPVIEELENLFSKFNARFFADKLEKPVITVSPDHTRGAYGWCTGWKAWKAGEDEGHYCKLVQNNTDGIIVQLADYDRDFEKIDDVVWEWEQRTGMKMDFDTFMGDIYGNCNASQGRSFRFFGRMLCNHWG